VRDLRKKVIERENEETERQRERRKRERERWSKTEVPRLQRREAHVGRSKNLVHPLPPLL
jgi:hypothetical protein